MYGGVSWGIFGIRLVTSALFCLSPQLAVYREGCGLRHTYNVFRSEIDWGGYRSRTPWLGLTCTMSRYDAVLAVCTIWNKKRWKRFNLSRKKLESNKKKCRKCCWCGHEIKPFDPGRHIDVSSTAGPHIRWRSQVSTIISWTDLLNLLLHLLLKLCTY